jgi:NADPH-dependent 2,4-dienoyl-CoA reductase/sulfur reductase-like enzyme/pSer/pThr/pTyr-binding forkhead associated (FHA) protein
MARKRYLIVGDGAAGITAAETLRRIDPHATIGIFSDEANPGYYRAALTNYLLGELREDQLWCVGPEFYEVRKIHRVFARVTHVDVARREIWDSANSAALPYDELLIAAGARPRAPTFPGADLPGVMTFRTLQDAQRVMERLRMQSVQTAAVLGGGPLGLELAHGLHERGVKVTIVERSSRFMPRVLDETASHLLTVRLRQGGIDVIQGEQVARAFPAANGTVGAIGTDAGRTIRCDLLCVALGVVPNSELLAGAGVPLSSEGAVQVDLRMQTPVAGIWAAGDCASVQGEVLQLWEPARLQGQIAGQNMAGQNALYRTGSFYFATRLFDLDFASVGTTVAAEGAADVVVDMPRGTGAIAYRKLVFKDGRLAGALLLGQRQARVRSVGRSLKRLIDSGLDARAVRDRLLDPGFFLDGWLDAKKLLAPPPRSAGTQVLAAAKVRGTQALDFGKSAAAFATAQVPLAPAADGTLALPSMNLQGAVGTVALPSSAFAALGTAMLGGGGRGTRVLSIGLHAEAPAPAAPPAAALHAELSLNGQRRALSQWPVRLGRGPECEVRLSDPSVALLHAEIVYASASLYLRDMGARGGTWVNGAAVSSAQRLHDGDCIRLGSTDLLLHAASLRREPVRTQLGAPAPRLELRSGAARGLSFALSERACVIGRAAECEIRIDELGLAPRHARIRGSATQHWVSDLGSELGTFLAGRRLNSGEELELHENAPLRLGGVEAIYTRAPRVLHTLLLGARARVVVFSGAEQGQSIALGTRARIGGQPGSDLCVSGLAPQQLEIVNDGRAFWAKDLAGGMFRAGAPLGSDYQLLAHGDLLLGPAGVMLRFEELE